MKRTVRNVISYIILVALVIVIVAVTMGVFSPKKPLIYSDIVELFANIGTDEESVKTFTLDSGNQLTIETTKGREIYFKLQDRERFYEDCLVYVTAYNDEMRDTGGELLKYNLKEPTEIPWWVSFLPFVIIIILVIVLYVYVINHAMGAGGGKIGSFGKSKAKMTQPDNKKRVLFSDVAGADEEKEELQEIVQFLKDPGYYTKLGAKIPHGVLLVGPPGTGKTLLAKAVAGEAGVPFFSISGSDFVEMYVGVGASRVRDLFENARKSPASIVFIDEIDAVGRHRGAGLGGGHDEREQTLNQLLVEMDGFAGNEGVIVIAATNRPDILDPALLRPGRFDRQITVNYPDINGREAILKVHSKGKPFEKDVDLAVIAKSTVGFTGADLANLLNEAALLAARRGKALIGMSDIEDATMKIIVGTQKKSLKIKEEEKRKTAYHEAGHAIVGHVLPHIDPVHQISIIPSGRALGYTLNIPKEDKFSVYKEEMLENIAMLLGGRVAEKLIFKDISGGAANDIKRATETAHRMVTELGMSDKLGPILFGSGQSEIFLGRDFSSDPNYSEHTAALIDEEIHSIIIGEYERAERILKDNIDKLHFIAKYLLEHEVMDSDQFEAVMNNDSITREEVEKIAADKKSRSEKENEEKRKIDAEKARREAQQSNDTSFGDHVNYTAPKYDSPNYDNDPNFANENKNGEEGSDSEKNEADKPDNDDKNSY